MAVFGSRAPLEISAVPLLEAQTASVRPAIMVFLVAACLLLATATANVASIQLARGTARRREVAVRAALGAGGLGLLRQSLVESAVLCVSGGAVGLLLAGLLHGVIPLLLPADFPRLADVRVDLRVAAFAVLVSLVASVAPGLLFALQARRVDIVAALAEDGRAPAGGGARSRAGRMRALIISGQMAVACALLVGAALLTRSFGALLDADRGYDPANVLTAALPLPDGRFTGAARATLMTTLLARLHAVPGVTHAAFTTALPLTRGDTLASFPVYSERAGTTVQAQAMSRIVSPEYFAAIRVRLAEGRLFGDGDTAASNPVVIVNRAFARKYLDDRPVGRNLWADTNLGPGPEVIGVVEDVHHRSITDPPAPEIYRTYTQSKDGIAADELALVLHTSVLPRASSADAVSCAIWTFACPRLIAPMEDLLRGAWLSHG
jgi:predicted permease